MKFSRVETRKYFFEDIDFDYKLGGVRRKHIDECNIELSKFDDGSTHAMVTWYGVDCRSDGEIDGRRRQGLLTLFDFVQEYEKAVELAKATGDIELVQHLNVQLAEYREIREQDRQELLSL